MAHMYFQLPVLEKFVGDAFQAFGFTKDESAIITDVLLTADMYGIESHGMQRLSRYDNGLKSGLIKLDAKRPASASYRSATPTTTASPATMP